jgi:hypothetical protein
MTKTTKVLFIAMMGLGMGAILMSCQKGPAQKAGEKIDNTVQDTKDAVHDAGHDIKRDLDNK